MRSQYQVGGLARAALRATRRVAGKVILEDVGGREREATMETTLFYEHISKEVNYR